MAAQPDISQILAALAATQRPQSTPSQTPHQPPSQAQPPQPPQSIPPTYPTSYVTPTPPAALSPYGLPQPTNSGSVDLSSIKPTSTGSVSIADALAKARNIAAEKGLQPYEASSREDPRLAGRPYRRSRSRSRSPPRRDNFRDNYNPYRDERREDRRYGRDRSRSPPSHGRDTFSPQRGYGGRDRSPPDSETITIESSLVGLVIGRQGENLRRIEQDTGTRIQFVTGPEAGGPQRQCRITGPMRSRADAKREIYRIIDENGGQGARDATQRAAAGANRQQQRGNQPVLRDGENSVQIMVPDRTVGLIIGRQGETIRDLQERSGCHVNIVGENKSVNGLRPVNLIGSREAATRAKELIMEIVESDTRPSGPPAKEHGRGSTFDPAGPGKINDSIVVPSEAVGMIIGKGGETIKEMQNSTGCKINVSQASGADIEREIGLVGTRQAIEDAKGAIWDKVDTVREKNGGVGSRGGRGRDNEPYNERYSQSQQQQGYAQQQPAGMSQQQAAGPGGDAAAAAGGADPYAMYGGYQNYMAMWYAALAQQQQGQPGQTPGQQPPGA
ncbi:kh domain-containing protein [Diplodia corticola]|uniref:Kh domain-containing protein n=1 Tax=Diplodia corticola TaxID=236234 RepID=A0A1J9RTP0_9PEZI|nr:kh domain-containing protein [Diplodia corticola]OJD31791.1 kh domain-containing protein [Diplodia corticola]